MNSLIEEDCKMHVHAQISRYQIFDLLVVIKLFGVTKNIILDNKMVTHYISCVQYKNKDKRVIIHRLIIIKRLYHIILNNNNILSDIVHYL